MTSRNKRLSRWWRWGATLGAIGIVVLASRGWGQRISTWRAYKVADGLPELGMVSLTSAPKGKLLVKHTHSFLSSLDGYAVKVQPLKGLACGRIFEGASGQLWTVVPGNLVDLRETAPVFYPVRELEEKAFSSSQVLNQIVLFPVRQGRVLVMLTNLLLDFSLDTSDKGRTQILLDASQTGLGSFSSVAPARDGGLWLAGSNGLMRLTSPARNIASTNEWQTHLIPPEAQAANLENPHENDDGSITAVATSRLNSEKVILQFDGKGWHSHEAGAENIRHAWKGQGDELWAMTTSSLLQWSWDKKGFEEDLEISARQYIDVAPEGGGTFWLATSDGLYRHTPALWENSETSVAAHSQVTRLASDRDGKIYFVNGTSLYALPPGETSNSKAEKIALPRRSDSQVLGVMKDQSVLLSAGEQLMQYHPAQKTFTIIEASAAHKLTPLGEVGSGIVCLQRTSGNTADNPDPELLTFDGTTMSPWTLAQPEVALGQILSTLLVAQNRDIWLGGPKGAACLHEGKWRSFVNTDKAAPEEVLDFAELTDGKIWCATPTKIWEFDGRKWSSLRRGFESVNRLQRTRDGSVWVGSNNGLHRYFQGNWIENGVEDGLPSTVVRDLCEDAWGHFWAATTRGIAQFHPEADVDPPRTLVELNQANEPRIPEGGSVTALFSGIDKWKFTGRGRLLYSHRLDSSDWTPFEEGGFFSGADLSPGKHFLQVRAMDRNANIDPVAAQINFAVVVPWYRESRLLFISVGALAVVLFFAGLAYNRHRRLVHSYAEIEVKVAERTQQLERANRELLHSEKMNALGTLAAGIAHDFNNILSIIKGSTQIIEENLGDPRKVSIRLDRIKTVVEQGAGIVKAMLGFSRDSEEPMKPEDLNGAVADTIKLLGDRFLREIKVSFEPGADLPEAACSKDFIQQILLNFIFNAAESVTSRNQIILSTYSTKTPPLGLALAPERTEEYVCLQVRDFGCGIPPENQARIFEPFFTTKAFSARRGTGLGLSMVYELAKKVKAGLAVESKVGEGSSFTLILPAARISKAAEGGETKPLDLVHS